MGAIEFRAVAEMKTQRGRMLGIAHRLAFLAGDVTDLTGGFNFHGRAIIVREFNSSICHTFANPRLVA